MWKSKFFFFFYGILGEGACKDIGYGGRLVYEVMSCETVSFFGKGKSATRTTSGRDCEIGSIVIRMLLMHLRSGNCLYEHD
jgi:hypothetical protein